MLNLSLSRAAIGRLAGASLMMSLVVASLPLASSQAASKPIVKHQMTAKHHKLANHAHKASTKKPTGKKGMTFGSYNMYGYSNNISNIRIKGNECDTHNTYRNCPSIATASNTPKADFSGISGGTCGYFGSPCTGTVVPTPPPAPQPAPGVDCDKHPSRCAASPVATDPGTSAANGGTLCAPGVRSPKCVQLLPDPSNSNVPNKVATFEAMYPTRTPNNVQQIPNWQATVVASYPTQAPNNVQQIPNWQATVIASYPTQAPNNVQQVPNWQATIVASYPTQAPNNVQQIPNWQATVIASYPTQAPNNVQQIPNWQATIVASYPTQAPNNVQQVPNWQATIVASYPTQAPNNVQQIPDWHATIVASYPTPNAAATANAALNAHTQATATAATAATAIAYPTVAYACYYGGYRCDATAQANPTFMPGHWCNGRYITGACDPAAGTPLPSQVIPLPAPPPGPAPTNQPVSAPAPVTCAPGYSLDVNICLINPSSNPYGPPSAGAGPVVAAPIISQPAATAVPAAAAPVATVAAVNPYCRYCLVASSVSASELLVQVPSHSGKHGARITVFALHIQPRLKVSLILAKKTIAIGIVSNRGSVLLSGKLSSKVKPGTYMLIVKASDGYSYDAGTYKVLL